MIHIIMLHIILALSVQPAQASSSTLTVTGTVPIIVKVQYTVTGNKIQIREISNNPAGYTVNLISNTKNITYDGKIIAAQNDITTITTVNYQDKSIDNIKELVVDYDITFVGLQITAN